MATPIFVLVGAALGSWALWIAEVCWIKGWPGLAWLDGFSWSALPICVIIAVSTSYILKTPSPTRFRFITATAALSLASFALARWSAFKLFIGNWTNRPQLAPLLVLLAAVLLTTVALPFTANLWLRPINRFTPLLVLLALLLILPLSFATIHFFPALNSSTDQLHAIKMGYPVFWTVLLIPTALLLGQKLYSD